MAPGTNLTVAIVIIRATDHQRGVAADFADDPIQERDGRTANESVYWRSLQSLLLSENAAKACHQTFKRASDGCRGSCRSTPACLWCCVRSHQRSPRQAL